MASFSDLQSESNTIALNDLANGTYFVTVQTATIVSAEQIVRVR
jgi:hypothetical protein